MDKIKRDEEKELKLTCTCGKCNQKKRWTEQEIEAIKINYAGVYARDLAIETGRTPLAIRLKARKLGLKSTLKNKGNGLDHKGSNNPNWKG